MEYYLIVSTVMMFVGIYGFVTRRNLLAMLISVELILNSVDINFVVFNRFLFPEQLEGFFFALFAIGISGYLISTADGKPISVFGWFDVPATLADAGAQADFAGALHFWLAWSVVVLSVMHGFMALKHHFIDKDDTLKRMLGKSSSDYGV